jgi:hypothetical protein
MARWKGGLVLVWRRRPDRTFLLLLGLALVLAITLIAIMVLTTGGEQRSRPRALADAVDAGTITLPPGGPPGSDLDRPPPARVGEPASGRGRPSRGRPDPDPGVEPEPAAVSDSGAHVGGSSPGGGGSGGEVQTPGQGGTTVGAGPVEVTVDAEGPSVTVSVGDLEVPIDAGGLVP